MPPEPPTPPAPRAPAPRAADPLREPRRVDCPWCGSARLRTRLRAPGPRRRAPEMSDLDECLECAHAFQNPRLTAEGLALHQRAADDEEPYPLAERPRSARRHRAAARAMLRSPGFTEPESWLDVGTGDARFPEAACELLAYTAFDGLDRGPHVMEARAAGRVEEAYVGRLTDPPVAARLRSRYDVVSLFHHLEHAPDPRAELRAALAVLRPGGHLLLELPDPHCAFAALLGTWWLPHGRRRPLHLMPLANLRAELQDQGCTILSVDRRAAHTPHDLATALSLALRHTLPERLARAGTPAIALATALDHTLAPVLRRTRFSNAYRLIARKP
ncbi:class I SAM-dependent methyltransferase [Streptomyces sp. V3I7]|uniref:class I SAM-dependent methyltransferase n=1 Tax=Streptomyces sp. V3I7 TaxID=3042278 RepID=UPI002785E857|nr:class I SAM-dependent methyltransferase [Streptomyces sp. V3I7]MDQ0990461.1 SAM-dependent methyltransferase [Streptomyces sp. V3I7]